VTVKVYVPAVRLKFPVPVYGGVPPVAVTLTVELPPLQRIGLAVADAVSANCGCVTVMAALDVEQLLASTTVKMYEPGPRENTPVPVYGGVPPEAVTVIIELSPRQRMGSAFTVMTSWGGFTSVVAVELAVHPLASVTVNEYVPARRLNVPVPV
jgi:hypothetical protein